MAGDAEHGGFILASYMTDALKGGWAAKGVGKQSFDVLVLAYDLWLIWLHLSNYRSVSTYEGRIGLFFLLQKCIEQGPQICEVVVMEAFALGDQTGGEIPL